ncbi:MAG: aminoglycoside phosphotransferase family protein [Burkholderiales bacterium]|nr:aminoglycoside phosphotransferase family protein [Burkholderiales bacterium]
MDELTQRAVNAARAVATRLGLRFTDTVLVNAGINVLVRFSPTNVLCRIATTTGLVRLGGVGFKREVEIARFLAARGLPVIGPSAALDAGPHEHDGLWLSFWDYLPATDEPIDAQAAAKALRSCHEALSDYTGTLVPWGAWEEARQIRTDLVDQGLLASADIDVLAELTAYVDAKIAEYALPLQAIHGDAHYENVMFTAQGLRWFDWEDCFLGPREWDIACMLRQSRVFDLHAHRAPQAMAGYGEEIRHETLDALVLARDLQAVSWGLLHAQQYDDAAERIASRMARMRQHLDRIGQAA